MRGRLPGGLRPCLGPFCLVWTRNRLDATGQLGEVHALAFGSSKVIYRFRCSVLTMEQTSYLYGIEGTS